MGVITYTDEYTSPIPPARLFQALVVDSHNLIPRLMPHAVKNIEFVQGDGGAGSIRVINFAQGSELRSVKNRVDSLDWENYSYSYTLIEGDKLIMDKVESISYEVKFEAGAEGGSKNRMVSTYYTKGDFELSAEDTRIGREKALDMYQVVEAYLLDNPLAYT